MSTRTLAASELLRIDFDAALEKLTNSQLDGHWQLPAELVRWAISCGATQADLAIGPRDVSLSAAGARVDREVLSDAAALFDTQLDAADRHRALVDLETRDAFVLAALSGAGPETARVENGRIGVELTAPGNLRIHQQVERQDLFVEATGIEINAAQAKRWVRRVARFAPIALTVNGRRIERGFTDMIDSRVHSEGELPNAIGIPMHGESPRLWLLRHGIISTRATIPGYPAFEAAIEMAGVTEASAPAAALRETLNSYVDQILDSAVEVLLGASRRTELAHSGHRARLARLLLAAASKRLRPAEIASIPIFQLQSQGQLRLISLDEIRRRVEVETGGICSLPAIGQDQELSRFSAGGRPVLILSAEERALLGELLQVVFSSPPHRLREPWHKRWRRRIRRYLGSLRARWFDVHRRRVSFDRLSEKERQFLVGLEEIVPIETPARHGFSATQRAVRTLPDGALLVGRSHPLVRAAIDAVSTDPRWWFPVAAVLLEDRLPPGHLSRMWRDSSSVRAADSPLRGSETS